jgi:HSP20 family protein
MSLLIKPQPLSTEFDRLFGRMFDAPVAQRWVPAMDLTEAEDHYLLKADLPGLSEEDISIEFEHGQLTVSGKREAEHERSEKGWHRIERSFGSFSRTLTLPEGVDADAVTAEFDRGVLNVQIPKPEKVKPRRIAVKSSNGTPPALEGTAKEK